MSQRFSDAELACEWWRLETDMFGISEYNEPFDPTWSQVDPREYERHAEIHETLKRFATLPHAHEEVTGKSALSSRIESGLADPISNQERRLAKKLRSRR